MAGCLFELGSLHVQLREFEAALADLSEAVERDPDFPEAKALLEACAEVVSSELQSEQYSFNWADGEDVPNVPPDSTGEEAAAASTDSTARSSRRAAGSPRHGRVPVRRVVLDRRSDKKPLGMKVRPFLSGFEVQEVLQNGLVADWNSAVPTEASICPGDKVVQVNDLKAEGHMLLAECSISEDPRSTTFYTYSCVCVQLNTKWPCPNCPKARSKCCTWFWHLGKILTSPIARQRLNQEASTRSL